MRNVGRSIPRFDAFAKVTGQAEFAADLKAPEALHMKLLFAGRPHARILSMDVTRATNHPDVEAVLTASDVPHNFFGIEEADQPVFCSDVVRYVGDRVAAVVARTATGAAEAAKLIDVGYMDLPTITDPVQAMEDGEYQIHPDHANNVAHTIRLRRGDAEAALAKSDVVVEDEFVTPVQEHAFLEPEAGLAFVNEQGVINVLAAGQSPHEDRHQIASALDLPLHKVRVKYGPIGGAFGGREDISVQIVLALATWTLRAPVRIQWNRQESILGHPKRHSMIVHQRWGANDEGHITAVEAEIIADAGAYYSSSKGVLDKFRYAAVGPYKVANVSVDGVAAFTNTIPAGAFRGSGSPQATFASELMATRLAHAVGMDPITFRIQNCIDESSVLPTRTQVPSGMDLRGMIEDCALEAGAENTNSSWNIQATVPETRRRRTGTGMAIAMKNVGLSFGHREEANARIELNGGAEIEQATLYTSIADVGQGSHSALGQIAAQALDIHPNKIRLVTGDTSTIGDSGFASASRVTLVAGNAVKGAAESALESWWNEDRPAVGEYRWEGPKTTPPDPETGEAVSNFSFCYCAQIAEVEVDTQTGKVSVRRLVSVHDPGQLVNPQQATGQVHGAIVQALGWTLTEDFIYKDGHVRTDSLSTYLIPTALDVPQEIVCVFREHADPVGPYGARGIGEIPFIPVAPAVVAAINDAVGIWINRIPLTPERVLDKLKGSSTFC